MMVSFSNGGLSADVSNKRPLENGYMPQFKPRKVSAIRDFPPGCGSNVMPMSSIPEANGSNRAVILEANGNNDSEMDNAAAANVVGNPEMGNAPVANGVGIPAMAVAAEPNGVRIVEIGNLEMTNKLETDNGVKTAETPELIKLSGVKNAAMGNFAGYSCMKNSDIEVEGPSHEANNTATDVHQPESVHALMKKMNKATDDIEKSMMEIGQIDIELADEVERLMPDTVVNTVEVESAESYDVLAGKVTVTATDALLNDVKMTEAGLVGNRMLRNRRSDSFDEVNVAGPHTMSKELNEVEYLAFFQNTDLQAAKPVQDVGASVDSVISHSQLSQSLSESIKINSSSIPKDKYRRRRVSAVRDFPPLCGGNVPLPDEEKEVVASVNDCLNKTEKIGTESEKSILGNALDGKPSVSTETGETLNNDAGRGSVEENLVENTPFIAFAETSKSMDFEECNREVQDRQAVPGSRTVIKAVVDKTIENDREAMGKEIVAYSPVINEDVWPLQQTSKSVALTGDLEPDSQQSVKKASFPVSCDVDGRPGALTFMEEDRGAFDEFPREITPVSMCKAVFDNTDKTSIESTQKDIVVYSPRKSDDTSPSPCASNSVEGLVRGLMAAPNCPWSQAKVVSKRSDRERSGEKAKKQNPLWQKNAKAVARKSSPQINVSETPSMKKHGKAVAKKSSPQVNFSGRPSMKKQSPYQNNKDDSPGASMHADDEDYGDDRDLPTDSPASLRTQDVAISLPPFGPNISRQGDARNRVRETLRLFHTVCRKLLQKEEANSMPEGSNQSAIKYKRIDLDAAKVVKAKGKEVNTEKRRLGEVPGVEVGDEFQYRVELAIVGIHRHYQNGIDSIEHKGKQVAISIVASGGYDDDVGNADVLIYSGQGGNVVGKSKKPEDQKLERGNLALKNSIEEKTPVRVVRGWKETKVVDPLDSRPKSITTYIYDGLYTVIDYWEEKKKPHNNLVFMFKLVRNPGQPELAWKELKKSSKAKFRPGVCVPDISKGKEPVSICAVNTIDDEKPPQFNYVAKMMYPDWFRPNTPQGCDCVGRCSDSKKCRCAARNGGEIPYNRNGAIVEAKPLVYECGPSCKCPPSCYNRVTQRGIKFGLEIFKTESRGWGVRCLTSIPSGSFICEYAGELLEDKEAEQRIGNDEYLFDIGYNYSDSSLKPEEQAHLVEEHEAGYTIDAAQYGNIGRFINHSCSPNLYAQNVIYDHDDKKMPHVMLFAAENIPPLQELTYHYNYAVDQVLDSDGNIKVKKCYCGTAECIGRMY